MGRKTICLHETTVDTNCNIWFCSVNMYDIYWNISCLVLSCFVLQTELSISPWKWIMSQPFGMFVALEIKQKLRYKFNEFFLFQPLSQGVYKWYFNQKCLIILWKLTDLLAILQRSNFQKKNYCCSYKKKLL